jgi:TetR/AcrR family transcriptional regulator
LLRRAPRLIRNIEDLLHRGKKSGVFRSDVDPVYLYISISWLGYHYLANRHTFSAIFDTDLTGTEHLERRLKHIEDVILSYLRYQPR